MVKPRSKQSNIKTDKLNEETIEALANKLADKPYGTKVFHTAVHQDNKSDKLDRITITIPQKLRYKIDDIALERKRSQQGVRSVSAIIREALEAYFDHEG